MDRTAKAGGMEFTSCEPWPKPSPACQIPCGKAVRPPPGKAAQLAGSEGFSDKLLSCQRSAIGGQPGDICSLRGLPPVTRFGHRHCAHQGGSISPLMIFTTCDASVAAIAKVTLTRLSLGRSSSIDNFCGVKSTRRNRK